VVVEKLGEYLALVAAVRRIGTGVVHGRASWQTGSDPGRGAAGGFELSFPPRATNLEASGQRRDLSRLRWGFGQGDGGRRLP
jgi:hypothetical protein